MTYLKPTDLVRKHMREIRKRRGWSAHDLADKCLELDPDTALNRSVIANLESGRRGSVSVDEVVLLALALDVAPTHLTVPAEGGPEGMRLTDDATVPCWKAWRWYVGLAPLGVQDELAYEHEQRQHQIFRYRLEWEVQRTERIFLEDSGVLRDVAEEMGKSGVQLMEAVTAEEVDREELDRLKADVKIYHEKFAERAAAERESSLSFKEARDLLRVYDDHGPEAMVQELRDLAQQHTPGGN